MSAIETTDKPKRILCIDAFLDNQELNRFILEAAGYEVGTAQSVTEGVKAAQASRFDLYLIDLSFPDGTGIELITRLRQIDRSIPIVVCSGNLRDVVKAEAMQAGAQAFWAKPIEPTVLVHRIQELI